MIKFATLAIALAVATPATVLAAEASESVTAAAEATTAPLSISSGRMLYATTGQRVAPVYRVNADGNPQVILNGKLITIPSSSLSQVEGKVVTSLTKAELNRVH